MNSYYRAKNFIIKIDTITGIRFNKHGNFYPSITIDTEGGVEYRIDVPDHSPKSMEQIVKDILEAIGWNNDDTVKLETI